MRTVTVAWMNGGFDEPQCGRLPVAAHLLQPKVPSHRSLLEEFAPDARLTERGRPLQLPRGGEIRATWGSPELAPGVLAATMPRR